MFSIVNVALVLATLAAAVLLFQPRLLKSETWQATVTPLASIIGSGFLVAGPILAGVAGNWAVAAMLFLCAVGYLFGAAIRYNIAHIEPELHASPSPLVRVIERASELSLAIAYFVSVAYYLHLFAAFGLRFASVEDMLWIRVAATVVIGGVGLIGATGGLDGLERVAVGAVALKLTLIVGLFAALIVAAGLAVSGSTFAWNAPTPTYDFKDLQVLLGLVVLVQGFETSRFLGAAYPPKLRIRTMRHAQWIATVVYLVFFVLITSYFDVDAAQATGETGIIDILRPVAILVPPLIIITALASQLSAGVADMNGAGGLLSEASGKRVSVKLGNALTAVVAIAIIWMADIFSIIVWASRMFVIFYALQSGQAAWSAYRRGKYGQASLFAGGVMLAVLVIIFAKAAAA